MWPTSAPILSGAKLPCLPAANLHLSRNIPKSVATASRCTVAASARKTTSAGPSDELPAEPKHRGRPRKSTSAEPTDEEPPAEIPPETPPPKKRGRKTKAEIEQANQAADQAFAAIRQEPSSGSTAQVEEEPDDLAQPAEGPGSWAEAAANTAGEEDRRRFPYHRRIHTAAQDGNVGGAEAAFASMAAVGLPPGPRAYHVLLCAYLKAGDVSGALDVTRRATDAGVQLLPESYAALIFSYMESSSPEVNVAKTLFSAMAGTDTDQQLPWSVLCRLLSSKGFAADTLAVVKQGLSAGLEMDADVAEANIKALCETQQSDIALRFLEDMAAQFSIRPDARHVNYVVEAEAMSGNLEDAAGLMEASGIRGWGRNAGTFNGYLKGLVHRIREVENPNDDDELVSSFATLRSRMVQSGVRPDKYTFKLEAEGFVELADARSAMSSITSMRNTAGAGGCRLLDPNSLTRLLQLLCDTDMPMDLLQLLVYMSEDSCRLPSEALQPDTEGRTVLSRWVVQHMEGIAARADARALTNTMLSSEIEVIDGYRIGPGRCIIDEAGLIVPVSKCTIKELRAEAKARDLQDAEDMKRPELVQAIKTARSRLPFNVLKAQVMRDESGVKRKVKPAAASKKRKPKIFREDWSIDFETGDADVNPAPRMYAEEDQYLLEGEQLEQVDVFDDQYGIKTFKDMQDVNFEAVMEARMLDEGAAAIMNIGDEDVASGFATLLPGAGEDEEDDDRDEDESPPKEQDLDKLARSADTDLPGLQEGYQQLLMLQDKRLDTEEANISAGMDVALDCVRAAEMLGGSVSPADVLVLHQAALAERSPSAAIAVAERLRVLLQSVELDATGESYDRRAVVQRYEELAEMCLRLRSPQSADIILEDAETAGLTPSESILNRLAVALRGRPRRSVRLERESAGLLEQAGLDVSEADDIQQLGQQQQQPGSSSTPPQLPAAAPEPAVVDVEATAVEDQPLQQQEQREDPGSIEDLLEADLFAPDQLDGETQHVMEILTGIAEMNAQREIIGNVIEKTGVDPDDVADILDDPIARIADTAWLAQAALQIDEPDIDLNAAAAAAAAAAGSSGGEAEEAEDEEAQEAAAQSLEESAAAAEAAAEEAAAGEGKGEGDEDEDEDDDGESGITLLELAHAAAEGSLTPEQNEMLLSVAERHQLPLMLDETAGQLIWPGTDEYEEWAAEGDNERLAQEDYLALGQAFEEEFSETTARADEWTKVMMDLTETDEGEAKPLPNPEDQESLDTLTAMFMDKLKTSGLLNVEEGEQGEAPSYFVNHEGLKDLNLDAELQQIAEEWGPLVEATRKEMEQQGVFDELRDVGVPVDELKLDTPRAGAASGSRLAGTPSGTGGK